MADDDWKWDKWQQKVLDTDGNLALRCGRQTGKSEVIGAKVAKLALERPNINILLIAAAERQGSMIFEKVLGNLKRHGDDDIFAETPRKNLAKLKNGSKIFSEPAGRTGHFIRGFSVDVLIADEAAFIPEIVWNAVIPMVAISRKARGMGWIYLLSTPFGKGGYFYDAFSDDSFKHFHVTAEDCKRYPKDFLRKEKKRMTKVQYAQEYMAEFLDEWHQFFPTKLIKDCMKFMEWKKKEHGRPGSKYYLGIDVARYGGDENAFSFVEGGIPIKCVKVAVTDMTSTVDTAGRAEVYDNAWDFARIGVDDSGVGGGVTDMLQTRLGKRRVLALNNASKRIQIQGEEKKRGIFKEDLYSNLLNLMEQGQIEFINSPDLMRSLRSIVYEYTEGGKVRIYGKYSHITEGLTRAVWCATKEKGLSLYIY